LFRVPARAFLAATAGGWAKASLAVAGREQPDGAIGATRGRAHIARGGKLAPWSTAGYGAPTVVDAGFEVDDLTPPSAVAAFSAGLSAGMGAIVQRPTLTQS
jgi:hypothetical protein